MDITKTLFTRIEKELKNKSLRKLKTASLTLSKKYRKKRKFDLTKEEKLAYIVARLPATSSVIHRVVSEIKNLTELDIKKVLDLGAGPASSFFALIHLFKKLNKVTYIEKDGDFIFLGKSLIKDHSKKELITWKRNRINPSIDFNYDLTLMSYVTNELTKKDIEAVINKWQKSKNSKVIVFIEPGTTYGFDKILFIRNLILKKKLNIIAPCPNLLKCPMTKNDWCHFSLRLKRSKYHKYIKDSKLGYEDEKYSYLIISKKPSKKYISRTLRHPIKTKGNFELTLCKKGKVQKENVTKKETNKYKIARKIKWGDIFEYE